MPRTGNRYSRPLYNLKELAQKRRDVGYTVRDIAVELGVSKSWVASNTTKEKEND